MQFESLVRFKALSQRYHSANPQITDHIIAQMGEDSEKLGLQKVQFLVSPQLKTELVNMCEYLEMTQREFLESMLADSLKKAWAVVQSEEATPTALGLTGEKN